MVSNSNVSYFLFVNNSYNCNVSFAMIFSLSLSDDILKCDVVQSGE